MKTTLGTLNRTRTSFAGTLTDEQIERPLALRNAARKAGHEDAQTFEFMGAEIAAYRNNVIEAIERNEAKLNGTARTGGIPLRIIEETLVDLIAILKGIDARLDAMEEIAADEVPTPIEEAAEAADETNDITLNAARRYKEYPHVEIVENVHGVKERQIKDFPFTIWASEDEKQIVLRNSKYGMIYNVSKDTKMFEQLQHVLRESDNVSERKSSKRIKAEQSAAGVAVDPLAKFFEGLTAKEEKVLRAILKHSECEYGLPCDKEAVAKDSGVSGKALSGVVSSLVKKGLVECYDFDYYYGEFFASEELFEAYNAE